MKTNIGTLDRIIRASVGVVLVGLTVSGAIGVWGWIGVVPIATSLIGYCPAYPLFGINTCGK
ncbi:MAG: DUF2892 domain-containing protein [Betaproteobacteria bacterium]